jgi:hypothetical protein
MLLVSLFAACSLRPGDAQAQQPQLNRCNGPGGDTIYTDRPCAAVGASERLPRSAIAGAYGLRRGGCARNLQDLIYEITAAIDNRDVNRLGAVYHWVGLDAANGDRVLDRLQAIVDRPLVDIVALRGATPSIVAEQALIAPVAPLAPIAPSPPVAAAAITAATPETDEAAAAAAQPHAFVRRPAVGLRLEQTLGKGSTPSRTILGLRRHLDCWWITL